MAYGVGPQRNPMGGSVAPKVQSINMAPRQQAMGRALAKPKSKGFVANDAFGMNNLGGGKGLKNPYKNQQPDTSAGVDVNGNPVASTTTLNPVKGGVVVPGTVGSNTDGMTPTGTGDPELDKYLAGDEVYQSILAAIKKNKDLSKVNYDYNVNNLNTDNDTIKRRLSEKEVQDNKLLDNDYAARGLFGSGLFGKADVDLGQSYADQNTDLATSLGRNLQQLLSDQTSQDALDDETRRQAQYDAITRRAQEFGIFGGPNNNTEQPDKKGGKKGNKKGGKK